MAFQPRQMCYGLVSLQFAYSTEKGTGGQKEALGCTWSQQPSQDRYPELPILTWQSPLQPEWKGDLGQV